MEIERDSSPNGVSEVTAKPRDTVVFAPVRAKLRTPEFTDRVRLILERRCESDTVVVRPIAGAREAPRSGPALLCH